MFVHLTLRSRNRKTGPIPVSTTSADTCPDSCPLKKAGCYADGGPLAILWRKVSNGEMGMTWGQFCQAITGLDLGTLWRHDQAGDLPRKGAKIDRPKLRQLTRANKGKRGFTYTHHDMDIAENRAAVAEANRDGFTVNVSANSPAHADRLINEGIWPVVTVLPADTQGKVVQTPAGRTISVCPATYRDDVSCQTCGLCAVPHRKSIVGFPAHGSSARKASTIAQGE